MTQKLLIIDDEPNLLYSMTKALSRESLEIVTAETGAEGVALARAERPQAAILDVRLPDGNGLDVFNEIRAIDPVLPVIIITAFASMETAVEAMKRGAYEYLIKPIELESLRKHVNRALEISVARDGLSQLAGASPPAQQRIIGRSPAIQEVFKAIGRVAQQDITVLIHGESGSGKELVAEAIREHSARADGPFLTINCAAIPEMILESELFGHERGAFTGADRQRIGKFEQVDGGTLFLDEIGDMSPASQAKVLRLLQDGSFQRVGGNQTLHANVRIIAATNRNLEEMVAAGTFREDLYYRLREFVIDVPALRERVEDVELLVTNFVAAFNRELGKQVRVVTPEALRRLRAYSWPGNVRELQTVVRHALLHAVGDTVTSGSLPPAFHGVHAAAERNQAAVGNLAITALVRQQLARTDRNLYRDIHTIVDRILLEEVLEHVDGSQVQAAQVLGISRTTLRNRLSELELSGPASGTDDRPS
ncbi:sigma-54-dependent transcriptional regulator [Lacipirellula limnantheis]|uniref:DNA-binding transcriptional regulator NtrC n=1 Tax=Lacipirellula limnantheis TaxID=2528024 RepID=A0A517U3H1_9BACT|nr:sigma-54 dependent transcriptional regulator [Lacipirellula limnantheis]QDT75170.1 Transcriptional regulatory protein ZraR [Lacipirellula limnantheis]